MPVLCITMHLSFYFSVFWSSSYPKNLWIMWIHNYILCILCLCVCLCLCTFFTCTKMLRRTGIQGCKNELIFTLFHLCILIELKFFEWECIHGLSFNWNEIQRKKMWPYVSPGYLHLPLGVTAQSCLWVVISVSRAEVVFYPRPST